MPRRTPRYEGKAKILYPGTRPGTLLQYFKDDATANNAKKHASFKGKGALNNRISARLMAQLNDIGIPTHFIKRTSLREQLICELDIIPIEIITRNIAAGTFSQRLGIEEGTPLPRTIIEYCYKNDELGDPIVAEEHITALGWAQPHELDEILALTLRCNDFLRGMFSACGLDLVDFKLEFGRLIHDENEEPIIMLADEISPDTCRLWDKSNGKRFDKDLFRRDLGNLIEAYEEVASRLGIVIAPTRKAGAA